MKNDSAGLAAGVDDTSVATPERQADKVNVIDLLERAVDVIAQSRVTIQRSTDGDYVIDEVAMSNVVFDLLNLTIHLRAAIIALKPEAEGRS